MYFGLDSFITLNFCEPAPANLPTGAHSIFSLNYNYFLLLFAVCYFAVFRLQFTAYYFVSRYFASRYFASCSSIRRTFSISSAMSRFERAIFSRTSAINASAFFDLEKKPMLFSNKAMSCSICLILL